MEIKEEIPKEVNVTAFKEGWRIYHELIEKFPVENDENFNKVLNSLCAALVLFQRQCSADAEKFSALVAAIIVKNEIKRKELEEE